jgi:trehalose 6-phosphate phosphatase
MPETNTSGAIADLFHQLDQATSSALLLDYDGTLAPFQIERDRAYPYPGVLRLLQEILRSRRTRIVIITGRPIHEVQALLHPVHGIEIWGAHGLDHLFPNGTRQQIAIDPESTSLLLQAEEWLHQHQMSSLLEVKPGGVAVHWRGLPEPRIQEIRSSVLDAWNSLADHPNLKLLHFEGGLELRVIHPDKGDAVASILRELAPNTPVAFLGDDLTDEDGFRKMTHHGLPILVRSEYRETAARAWLKPPEQLFSFLEQWLSHTTFDLDH